MAGSSDGSPGGEDARRERAAELFAEALARIEGGEAVDLRALALEHRDFAPELEGLRARWEALEAGMARFGAEPDDPSSERALLEALSASDRRADRYRLGPEIARGGMGAVIEVFDRDLARVSAMKVADLDGAVGSQGRRARLARFLREARITGRLEHPGIVPVHDLGVDDERRPFFTMPLVRGHDLRTIFVWVREEREGWSVPRALGVLLKVCEAVSYAHSRGVLHRDLKPANVMVGRYGEVHVMDWGLAKLTQPSERDPLTDSWSKLPPADGPDGSPLHTREGDVLGTPAYMPPEQAAGRLEALDERADVYAIGAMLYHLLAGEAPYGDHPGSSSAREVLTSVVTRPPTPLAVLAPGAPPEEVAICERAMAREPADRYPSVKALGDDLRALLEGRVVSAYERGAWPALRKWVRRNRALAALLVVLALAIPLAASFATYVAATREDVLAAERHALEARVESALEEGYLELGEGDPELARAHFDAALAEAPASIEAAAGLAIALMQQDRFADALIGLERSLSAADPEPGLALLRADALRTVGRAAEAEEAEAAAAGDTRSALDAYLRAQRELSRAHAGDEADAFARAAELSERALRLSRTARPLYAYSWAHALGHHFGDERALAAAEMLEALWPDEPRALHWAGFARTSAGGLEEGTRLLARAVELRPENEVHRFTLAWASMRAGEFETAERLFRAILRDRPDSHSTLINLTVVLRQRGEHEEAIEVARRAVELLPERAVSHWSLARVLRVAGHTAETVASYREALRIAPGNRNCRRGYAEALSELGQHEEAVSELEALVAEDPLDAASVSKLGVIRLRAGQRERALEDLHEALRLDPSQPGANVQLGLLREREGDLAAARAHYEAAAARDPRDALPLYNIGCLDMKEGRNQEAIASFERALRFEPGLPEAHCNLAHALLALGRFEEAIAPFRRGHELGSRKPGWKYPSTDWIREAETKAAAERRLAEVLADPARAHPFERAELAAHALDTRRAQQALELFESALADEPGVGEDARGRFFARAARAAVTTAQGNGDAALRLRALEWLELDLAALEGGLAEGALEPAFVASALDEILEAADFATVRDEATLRDLPAAEADTWRAHWAALADLRLALAEEGR